MENKHMGNELLPLIAKGDEAAFRSLYNLHWNRLYAFSLAWLKSGLLAEDVVQDVFLKIWTNRQQLGAVKNADNYLFIICRNLVLNILQKNTVRRNVTQLPGANDEPELPVDVLQLKEMQTAFYEEIEKLPPQQKQIFKMSREEGLTHEQIAQQLGIMKETVKNHLVRALNTLRRKANAKSPLISLVLLFL